MEGFNGRAIILIAVTLTVIVSIVYNYRPSTVISPISTTTAHLPPTASSAGTQDARSLERVIQQALVGTNGSYGIVVKHLSTGESTSVNGHKSFNAASLYKLWIMAVVYAQIQSGVLKEDQVLSQNVSVLNEQFDIASESAELTEGTITLAVADALTKMITVSDNYAALLLAEKVRLSRVASFLKTNGFTESAVGISGGDPTTTPADIALFFEKLYAGQLASEKYSQEMIRLLKGQRLNNKLPKYMSRGTVVAHKTGELGTVTHDAGIVYTPTGNYLIVILSDSEDPKDAEEKIAEISKRVYDYFEAH